MSSMIFAADINPMYYGTLAFLMFAAMLASIGFWAIYSYRRNQRDEARAAAPDTAPEAHSRSAE